MVWWIVNKMRGDTRRSDAAAPLPDRVGPFASSQEAEAERQRLARQRRLPAQKLQIVCDFG